MPLSPAIKLLNDMQLEEFHRKYPGQPYPSVKKFDVKTANGLTGAVIKFLTLKGHQAERISVTGRMIDQRKTYVDVLGHTRQIGSVKWIKSSMVRGSADISAVLAPSGRSLKIEIKVGRDTQRDEQKDYQAEIERTGGIYLIVRTFDGFVEWYMENVEQKQQEK